MRGCQISSSALLERMKLDDLEDVLRTRRMRWFGHVERSEGWISKVLNVDPGGRRGRGRPRKTWLEDVRKDRAQLGLDHVTPSDRNTWAGTLRSAVRQDPPLITRDKCPV